jgi:hypothetical protein
VLKDPYDDREIPYEMLDLPYDAPLASVQSALKRWMIAHRRQPGLLGRAQNAAKQLQSPKTRAGIDIWFYPSEEKFSASAPGSGLALDAFLRVPTADPGELPRDLLAAECGMPLPEWPALPAEFAEMTDFDCLESTRLDPAWEP